MSTQRRDTDRETAESVERMWQTYADEIGIPRAGPPASNETLSRHGKELRQTRRSVRVTAGSVGRLLAAVAVVVVAMIAGIALWPKSWSSPDTAYPRSATPVSAPAGEADRIAQHAAPGTPAGAGLQASASAVPPPSEMVDPLRSRPEPDTTVSRPMQQPVPPSTAAFRPEATPTSGPPTADTKHASTDVMDRINFDFSSDSISDEAKQTLEKIVGAMKANPEWRVVIEGHTDAQGTPDYNRSLSERRAQAVKGYLQSAGIAPGRLSAVGFGSSRPLAPNDAWGKGRDRRVEFHRHRQ